MIYDLPPLPYPQMPGNDYTAEDMRKYAIAAIERYKARTPDDRLREAARMALEALSFTRTWAETQQARDALRAALEGK